MKTRAKTTKANARAPKDIRDRNLSKDGKWRSFPKVPNLLQYVSTGTFYGRATVDGKIYRESLKTTVLSVAKQKLSDYVKEKLRKKRQIGAPATFAESRKLYEQDLENDHALSETGQAHNCADLVRFVAFSGCRISEARKVRWSDVNFDRGLIIVHNAKTRKTNNAAATRNVPIIPDMRSLLDKLAKKAQRPQDLVCAVGECEKSLTRACRLLGIPRITHHDLRHLFATRCIESGVDIPTVSRWLGHSDGGALAMKVYGHLRDQHSAQMAQRVTFSLPKQDNEAQSSKQKAAPSAT